MHTNKKIKFPRLKKLFINLFNLRFSYDPVTFWNSAMFSFICTYFVKIFSNVLCKILISLSFLYLAGIMSQNFSCQKDELGTHER